MSFASQKFLPTGTYIIINAKHDLSIGCREEDDVGLVKSTTDENIQWSVTLLTQKKWIIESRSNGFTADIPPDPEEEDDICTKPGEDQPHQWVIKKRQADKDTYIIYSPKATGLFWGLMLTDEGASPQLLRDNTDSSTWWKFKNVDAAGQTRGSNTNQAIHPLDVTRPTLHPPLNDKHRVAITIPPGWLTTISAVSVGQCTNLIRISRKVEGVLELQDFISPWESVDTAMVLSGNDANSYALQAVEETSVLILELYHSKNTRRRDPLGLPAKRDFSNNLRTTSNSRPTDMRNFPDYQTFWIFDETPNAGHNAIVTIHSTVKTFVDYTIPDKPDPDKVNDGYNLDLDRPRPGYMDEYLDTYDIIFVIDDSGSMSGSRWKQVRAALSQIGDEAMQYDADGVDMLFINSTVQQRRIKAQEQIWAVFDRVRPYDRTPTGARLKVVLGEVIQRLNRAVDTPIYGHIRPIDIIVITDGEPTDDVATVIQEAAQLLDEGLHHPNAVGIQFVQIGNEEGADVALNALCDGPVRSMVDTVPYVEEFTPERLKRVLLGAMHPSIRAKFGRMRD